MAIRRHGDRRHANPSPVLAIGNQPIITVSYGAKATHVSSARIYELVITGVSWPTPRLVSF
jgi:hypothetical protein